MTNKLTDWIVRIYDGGEVVDAWFVPDRTRSEAHEEAGDGVARMHPGKDWTLGLAEEMDGEPLHFQVSGDIWINAHVEVVHDVLWHEMHHIIRSEWDWDALERAIADAIYDHLAGRAHLAGRVSAPELEAYEEWLDGQGQQMVEVELDLK